MTRRWLLVLAALVCGVVAFGYGLEQPAAYDVEAATYFYPRAPHRTLVLAAGLVGAAVLLILAARRRPEPGLTE